MSRCEAELCPNWSGDGDVCPCAVFGLERPAVEEPDPCRACGGPGDRNWFDRSICQDPCGDMHTRCEACGAALDGCPHETAGAPNQGGAE